MAGCTSVAESSNLRNHWKHKLTSLSTVSLLLPVHFLLSISFFVLSTLSLSVLSTSHLNWKYQRRREVRREDGRKEGRRVKFSCSCCQTFFASPPSFLFSTFDLSKLPLRKVKFFPNFVYGASIVFLLLSTPEQSFFCYLNHRFLFP